MNTRPLWRDRRGSAALTPVFLILAVLTIATVVSALLFTQSVSERTTAQQETSATTRSAIAAIQAELSTKTPAQLATDVAASGHAYTPAAWIKAPGQTVKVSTVSNVSATATRVTFTTDIAHATRPQEMTVEYLLTPLVYQGGQWVDAAAGQTPQRSVWMPARTIQEAP